MISLPLCRRHEIATLCRHNEFSATVQALWGLCTCAGAMRSPPLYVQALWDLCPCPVVMRSPPLWRHDEITVPVQPLRYLYPCAGVMRSLPLCSHYEIFAPVQALWDRCPCAGIMRSLPLCRHYEIAAPMQPFWDLCPCAGIMRLVPSWRARYLSPTRLSGSCTMPPPKQTARLAFHLLGLVMFMVFKLYLYTELMLFLLSKKAFYTA